MQKVSLFTAALRTPKFQLYYLIDYFYYNSYKMLDVYRKKKQCPLQRQVYQVSFYFLPGFCKQKEKTFLGQNIFMYNLQVIKSKWREYEHQFHNFISVIMKKKTLQRKIPKHSKDSM